MANPTTTHYGWDTPDLAGTDPNDPPGDLKHLADQVDTTLFGYTSAPNLSKTGNVTAGGTVAGGSVTTTGPASAAQFRFGLTGNEVVIQPESNTVIQVLNPGASLWATIKAGRFAEQSSRRYKERIRATRYGLADLLALRPVDYHYKATPDIPQTGLIAEDVAGIYPEAVTYDEGGQPDGIDYSKLTPLLLAAVQELAARVEELERRGA